MPSSDRVHPARTELQSWVGIAVAIAPAVLAACTLRDGHAWGDDFAQYLVHTRNLVEGKPYGELGFIRAPIHAIAYPPGFPLLLAPVYWVFGGSLTAMKLELALFFAGTMLIVRRHLSRQLPARVGVALVALVAWNPVFWEFRDNILSDIPFLFFVALSFLAADLSEEAERVGSRRWALILLAAASMVMATLCRTLGAVLPFSLLFAGLIRQQRVSRTTAVCLVAVISSLLICAATLPPSGEATALRALFNVRAVAHTAEYYRLVFDDLWDTSHSRVLRAAVGGVAFLLAAIGVASRLKPSKVAPQDIAAALLMGVLLIWPFRQGIRYAFPVVPLYFFYVLTGALALEGRLKLRGFPVIKGLLGAALLIYAIRIGTDGIGPKQIGIATPASQQLLDWTRRNTLQSELIVASKSRAISYLTGRRTALGGVPGKVDLPQYLTEVGATYVIIGLPDAALFDASVRAHSSMFEKRFKNAEYEVFRWKGNVDSALALQMSSAVAR